MVVCHMTVIDKMTSYNTRSRHQSSIVMMIPSNGVERPPSFQEVVGFAHLQPSLEEDLPVNMAVKSS